MAFLESKWEYRDGDRIPMLAATSRSVTAESPSRRAISHAASRISRLVASRRSARLSRLGKALIVRQSAVPREPCQGAGLGRACVRHAADRGPEPAADTPKCVIPGHIDPESHTQGR